MVDPGLLAWLLDSDPCLRWQVERDLAAEPEDVWRATVPGSRWRGSERSCSRIRTRTASGRAGPTSRLTRHRKGGSSTLRQARHRGEEYLLQRNLMRRLSTGEVHAPWATHFAYPYRWSYSVLRAADYLRSAFLYDGRRSDDRMADALELIRAARDADGTWHQQLRHEGRTWFDVDSSAGEASRWLTFHALRVIIWWDGELTPHRAAGRCHAS